MPSLKALAAATDVVLVVTQPNKPAGRGKKIAPPPVKTAAQELGLQMVAPSIVKGRRFSEYIAGFKPDFIVTAAFGRILGRSPVLRRIWLRLWLRMVVRYGWVRLADWLPMTGRLANGVIILPAMGLLMILSRL